MILIAENRKRQMGEVLSHPLGPLPWALSTADGPFKKQTKQLWQKNYKSCAILRRNPAAISMYDRCYGAHAETQRGP